MKLRIKGNSLRMRLTKTEVSTLARTGFLEDHTRFINSKFVYSLRSSYEASELSATFSNGTITIFIPASFVQAWPENEVVGINTNMPLANNESLYLLIEKDFICLDETTEDQSDNYENPNKTC